MTQCNHCLRKPIYCIYRNSYCDALSLYWGKKHKAVYILLRKQWCLYTAAFLYTVTGKGKSQVLASCKNYKSTMIMLFMRPLPAALPCWSLKSQNVILQVIYNVQKKKRSIALQMHWSCIINSEDVAAAFPAGSMSAEIKLQHWMATLFITDTGPFRRTNSSMKGVRGECEELFYSQVNCSQIQCSYAK